MGILTKINGLREIWRFENRWHLIFSRLLFPLENVQMYRIGDIEFLSDHSAGDANGAREILCSQMYRRFLDTLCLSPKVTVVDFGANNGGFPLLLKSEGIEISSLVCVELNPQTYSRLFFNLERNFSGRFTALNYAVCGTNREIKIVGSGSSTADSIYEDTASNSDLTFLIEGKTVNEIFDEAVTSDEVDICKMDVEGAEFEIFANPERCSELVRCRYILIEIHGALDRPATIVLSQLLNLGFVEKKPDPISPQVNGHHVHLLQNVKHC